MNTFKKPYNPNIRKTFSTIIAPQIEEDTEKIAQLFILVEQGNIAGVKKLILSNRVKINAKYNDETILHKVLMIDDVIMSESKKLDFIKYLVSNGAFINSYNKFNVTPLHLAVQKKYSSIVKYFIDNKANIDAVTSENLTPLHYATLVNIDSCPLDNMPENIIPTPTAKNTKYNDL
jgi:ankyrin repeat protein